MSASELEELVNISGFIYLWNLEAEAMDMYV
jgi:hypothetical protein